MPEAPAPLKTTRTWLMSLPTTSSGVQQRRAGDDGRAVLIVVKNRDRHGLAQGLLNVETFGRLDVFQVDSAERGFKKLAEADDVVGVFGIHLQVKNIDIGEALEQDALALHHRLARQRADVAEAQHRRAVGNHRHQVAPRGVFEPQFGLFVNFQARFGHAGRVGQTQIPLSAAGLGGSHLNLALAAEAMIIERILLANFHDKAPLNESRQWAEGSRQ